jgi:hypothetical protein
MRQQQLFLVDDKHDADEYDTDEQHPDDNDAGDDAQAQVQTGLLSCRFIAATRRS